MKKSFIIFILSCLCCCCLSISVFALEEVDNVKNFTEMKAWLNAHISQSGTVNLMSDIYINEDYVYENNQPITINTNGYTLYVQAQFITNAYAPDSHLTIQGPATENGLLHILKAGYCDIANVTIHAPEDSVAFVQDDESILITNNIQLTGRGEYASHPQLISSQFYLPQSIPYITLCQDEKLEVQSFPNIDDFIEIVYQGKKYRYADIPLKWNINEYTNPQSYSFYHYHACYNVSPLEINEQTFLNKDITIYAAPIAHVISTKGGSAIIGIEKKWASFQKKTYYEITMQYKERPDDFTLYLRSSADDNWQMFEMNSENYIDAYHMKHLNQLKISIYNENPYLEFYMETLHNNTTYNSNVVIMNNGELTFDNIEGGRGGGIDITPDHNQDDSENKPDTDFPDTSHDFPPINEYLPSKPDTSQGNETIHEEEKKTSFTDKNFQIESSHSFTSSMIKSSTPSIKLKENASTQNNNQENIAFEDNNPHSITNNVVSQQNNNIPFIQLIIGCLCISTLYFISNIVYKLYKSKSKK